MSVKKLTICAGFCRRFSVDYPRGFFLVRKKLDYPKTKTSKPGR